jgi:hypothetical protein
MSRKHSEKYALFFVVVFERHRESHPNEEKGEES